MEIQFYIECLAMGGTISSYRDGIVVNANNDDLPDILLVGNFYENNIQMGRYDADFGTILLNRGQGQFTCEPLNGVALKGEARHIRELEVNGRKVFVIAKNNDSAKVIGFK